MIIAHYDLWFAQFLELPTDSVDELSDIEPEKATGKKLKGKTKVKV